MEAEKSDNKINAIVNKIEGRYDAEFDIIPDGPRVTWAEADLADAIKHLLARIKALEAIIEANNKPLA